MRATLCVAVLTLLSIGGAAQAGETNVSMPPAPIQAGTSVLCDTQQQMERFVAVYEGDPEAALVKVNAEANKSNACVVATIAYVPGQDISKVSGRVKSFKVVRVLVVGVETGRGIAPVKPAPFFSLVAIDEMDA